MEDPQIDPEEQLTNGLHTAAINFSVGILCCSGLQSLEICICHSFSLTNALLDAARQLHSVNMHDLQHLVLFLHRGGMTDPPFLGRDEAQYLECTKLLLGPFSMCR